jgi:putative endonuclease
MAYEYILYSENLNRFYIGSCNDIKFRLEQHVNKEFIQSFTSKANDWNLFYYMDNLEYDQARALERHIKNMKSKMYINNLKKYPEIMEKLLLKYKV